MLFLNPIPKIVLSTLTTATMACFPLHNQHPSPCCHPCPCHHFENRRKYTQEGLALKRLRQYVELYIWIIEENYARRKSKQESSIMIWKTWKAKLRGPIRMRDLKLATTSSSSRKYVRSVLRSRVIFESSNKCINTLERLDPQFTN